MSRPTLTDRPHDHIDSEVSGGPVSLPRLGVIGWLRWAWTQLTSMRTAIMLLLLLAFASIPGSLFPQRTSDPNGVIQYFRRDPSGAATMDSFGLFSVYSSPWFSAIYLLLFVSLIGCLIPRTRHHIRALRAAPPRTPKRLSRLPEYQAIDVENPTPDEREAELTRAENALRKLGYRTGRHAEGDSAVSVSAERGYLRETGNLAFHLSLMLIIASVAVGGWFSYTGQRVIVEGQSFVSTIATYDSFRSGTLFGAEQLAEFALTLDSFEVDYIEDDAANLGFITDYRAGVTVTNADGQPMTSQIRVNEPLAYQGLDIYLLGNGYAPRITVRDPSGTVVYSELVPFLPQDSNLTSLGVVKLPDGLAEQVGLLGFFYPTQATIDTGAFTSIYPDLQNPVMTLNVFTGDLGINTGTPRSVYSLDTSVMSQLTGGDSGVDSLQLAPGETVELPDGLGTVEFEEVRRFASLDFAYDPTKTPVFIFVAVMLVGLMLGLFVPRRRVWVRVTESTVEYAALARGDDPTLATGLNAVVAAHSAQRSENI